MTMAVDCPTSLTALPRTTASGAYLLSVWRQYDGSRTSGVARRVNGATVTRSATKSSGIHSHVWTDILVPTKC